MIEVDPGVRIERPIEEVFDYVSDARNFSRCNSTVRSMTQIATSEDGAGATYTMQRDLPTGSGANVLGVVRRHRPIEFMIKTTSGPRHPPTTSSSRPPTAGLS